MKNPTNANAESSRSHAILQISIKRTEEHKEQRVVKQSKFTLIDLAGSERASQTLNRGIRLFEGAQINKSLLALGNCIKALVKNWTHHKKEYVPYRDSKLTRLLKNSLQGNCRTVMIINISPSALGFEDTHNSLIYANRSKNIKTNLKQNFQQQISHHISVYQEQMKSLLLENRSLKEKIQQKIKLKNSDLMIQEHQEKLSYKQ